MTSWTNERVDRLKQLWADGHSASEIAMTLGGTTRNAVIGKVNRLGLSGRVKVATKVARHGPVARPKPPPGRDAKIRLLVQEGKTVPDLREILGLSDSGVRSALSRLGLTARRSRAKAAPRPRPKEPPPPPEARMIPLMELTATTCKWPIGDPQDKDFGFCGTKPEKPGSPYCAHHAHLAYVEPVKRAHRSRPNWNVRRAA